MPLPGSCKSLPRSCISPTYCARQSASGDTEVTVYRRPDPIPLHRGRPSGDFALRRVRPEQEDLHHLVARQIFAAITGGHYPEGSILPTEQALSEELGVSRTALREAIKGLASKGMLETRRRRGTMVLDRSCWNMLDVEVLGWLRRDDSRAVSEQLWQTVAALLPSLAGIAARRGATPSLRASRAADGQGDLEARVDLILEIARAAGNRFSLSIVTAAVRSLFETDRSFLDNATSGLTSRMAGSLIASISASDSRGAHATLQNALDDSHLEDVGPA
jgi:DNA-binding FadR family transcriptional regulator